MDNIKKLLDEMMTFRSTKEIEYMGDYGKGKHKSLKMTLDGSYRVYNQKELVLETIQPYKAIDTYLSI